LPNRASFSSKPCRAEFSCCRNLSYCGVSFRSVEADLQRLVLLNALEI
jgi:hypothetical protein